MYSFFDFYFLFKNFFLVFFIFFPLISIIFLSFFKRESISFLKQFAFLNSLLIFFISLFFWLFFDNFCFTFQYTIYLNWFFFYNINYSLGIDGISLLFIILTTFLFPFCILISWNSINYRLKEFLICLFLIEFFLLNIFCALDIFLFYLYF